MMYVAKGDPGQTVFILLEEPESSTLAKFTSLYMQVRVQTFLYLPRAKANKVVPVCSC